MLQFQAGLTIDADSGITLDSLCSWQAGWNPAQDSNPQHADYVALITKYVFVYNCIDITENKIYCDIMHLKMKYTAL